MKILGIDQLLSKLNNFSKKEVQAACRKAVYAGAVVHRTEARKLAPEKTRKLKRGFKITRSTYQNNPTAKVVLKRLPEMWYGSFQEFGTKFMKPKHFIEQAFKNVKEQMIQAAQEKLKDEISKWR